MESGVISQWETPPPDVEPDFPTVVVPQEFLVEECRGRATTRMAIIVHFLHRYVRDTVIIMEEGTLPHPRCPRCDILVPYKALNGRHVTTAQCDKGG